MSGRMTPMDMMPTPDLAVPYAAPRFAKMMAEERPMKPKKAEDGSQRAMAAEGLLRLDTAGKGSKNT